MKIINKIKGYFTKIPLEYLRRYTSGFDKKYECEKILGNKEKVIEFSEFYKENYKDLEYIRFVLEYKYKGTAKNFIGFLLDCSTEEETYKTDLAKAKEDIRIQKLKEKRRKTLHK